MEMLALGRDRANGAHPYNTTPQHTRWAREILGPERLLVPEQAVLLVDEPMRARAIARAKLKGNWSLPNYANSFKRLGFSDADLAGDGSDALVDALVAWGTLDQVLDRIQEHLDAGADQVAVQVLPEDPLALPTRDWERLAEAIGLKRRSS
jgi:probable F420-dependent oxidoreductase